MYNKQSSKEFTDNSKNNKVPLKIFSTPYPNNLNEKDKEEIKKINVINPNKNGKNSRYNNEFKLYESLKNPLLKSSRVEFETILEINKIIESGDYFTRRTRNKSHKDIGKSYVGQNKYFKDILDKYN